MVGALSLVRRPVALAPGVPDPSDRQARIRAMVDDHMRFVARTLRHAGVPPAELDDEIQRTFMVVSRRLDDVQLGAERRFLFQVAINMAAHTRRNLARRREVPNEGVPEPVEARSTPEELIHRKRMRTLLDGILGSMDKSLRDVFTLFEIEEMNMSEIGAVLHLPRGTVASRLRRARAQLRKHAQAVELAWDLGAPGAAQIAEPASMRRGKVSALVHALLKAGTAMPESTSAHARTLAVLGLAAPPMRPTARAAAPR